MNKGCLGHKTRGRRYASVPFGWRRRGEVWFPDSAPFEADRTTYDGAASSTHNVNLPVANVAPGDLMIAMLACSSAVTVTSWTSMTTLMTTTENSLRAQIHGRLCDGTEGGLTPSTITLSGASLLVAAVVLIKGAFPYTLTGNDFPNAVGFVGSDCNPPNMIFGRGRIPALIVSMGFNMANSARSNPGDMENVSLVGTSSGRIGMGTVRVLTDSFDPASWGAGTSNNRAAGIWIPPAKMLS